MPTYEFDRTSMDDGRVVNSIEYEPNGTDHRLQRRITELLDRIAQNEGKWTLAEMGYLHMNTVNYNAETGAVNLKVYFDVHYACRVKPDNVNGKKQLVPVNELNAFEKYLFVGPLTNAVSIEKIMAPKSKMVEDGQGRAAIRFKDDAKLVETTALVLNCNLPITMAALHDINLMDPQFQVKCTTVGRGGATKEKTIITSGKNRIIPVRVTVTAGQVVDDDGNPVGYDPSECQAYLLALREKQVRAAKNKEKIANKARDKAGKAKREHQSKGFLKYS